VVAARQAIESELPFVPSGIDSDNGPEFINHDLARCADAMQSIALDEDLHTN
jgi:hypothetical protein